MSDSISESVRAAGAARGSRLKPLDLMATHVDTLFVHDELLRLLAVNQPPYSTPAPYVFIGITVDGNVWRYRETIGEPLRRRLSAEDIPFRSLSDQAHTLLVENVLRKLENHGLRVGTIWKGPAYYLPTPPHAASPSTVVVDERNSTLLESQFPQVVRELPHNRPCVAVVHDGIAVSVCRTVRTSARCAEAGVQTAAPYRRRGYALQAASRWASVVRESGLIPLYSTSWDNIPSQRLARSVGFVQYGVDLHFSP